MNKYGSLCTGIPSDTYLSRLPALPICLPAHFQNQIKLIVLPLLSDIQIELYSLLWTASTVEISMRLEERCSAESEFVQMNIIRL